MPPSEVLERFSETELVHLVAYENRYGQLGPERLDTLFGRLGMDVVAPHMGKGKKPKFEDHVVSWGRKAKAVLNPAELLAKAKQIQGTFERRGRDEQRAKAKAEQLAQQRKKEGSPDGNAGRAGSQAQRRRRRR